MHRDIYPSIHLSLSRPSVATPPLGYPVILITNCVELTVRNLSTPAGIRSCSDWKHVVDRITGDTFIFRPDRHVTWASQSDIDTVTSDLWQYNKFLQHCTAAKSISADYIIAKRHLRTVLLNVANQVAWMYNNYRLYWLCNAPSVYDCVIVINRLFVINCSHPLRNNSTM